MIVQLLLPLTKGKLPLLSFLPESRLRSAPFSTIWWIVEREKTKEDRRENIDFLPLLDLKPAFKGERANSMQRGEGNRDRRTGERRTSLFGLRERLLFWFTFTFTAGQTLHSLAASSYAHVCWFAFLPFHYFWFSLSGLGHVEKREGNFKVKAGEKSS